MKAELFKTDRNIKILIVSNESDYKSIIRCNPELFKSDIEFVAEFKCENKVKDLMELLKPDVLLSEKGIKLNLKVIKPMDQIYENGDVHFVNNNGCLVLWYVGVDVEKISSYFTLSFLINHSHEIKNKLGVE